MENLQLVINKLNNENNSILIGNFLDDIRFNFSNNSLNKNYFDIEPIWPNIKIQTVAFFTGCLHSLCHEFKYKVPKWMYNQNYFLTEPYFSMNAKGNLRLILLGESPKEFRIRNIYVTNNVLRRV